MHAFKKRSLARRAVRILCGALALLFLTFPLVGCDFSPLRAVEVPETMSAGETKALSFTRFGKELPADALYYASADSAIVSVDENGTLTAHRAGETAIRVQLKETGRQAEFPIRVEYAVRDFTEGTVHASDSPTSILISRDLPFFKKNGYTPRIEDDDLVEIVKLVASKGDGDYVFTDVYHAALLINTDYLVLSEWANGDVSIDPRVIARIDLGDYLAETVGIPQDLLVEEGKSIAERKLALEIGDAIRALDDAVALSALPEGYEYRVAVKINLDVYRVENFYSRGLVKGVWQLLSDLWKWNVDTFLDSYTSSQEKFEVILNKCELVIERRPTSE